MELLPNALLVGRRVTAEWGLPILKAVPDWALPFRVRETMSVTDRRWPFNIRSWNGELGGFLTISPGLPHQYSLTY
jgi:hypothetical protein